jgi:hypothetical protein
MSIDGRTQVGGRTSTGHPVTIATPARNLQLVAHQPARPLLPVVGGGGHPARSLQGRVTLQSVAQQSTVVTPNGHVIPGTRH